MEEFDPTAFERDLSGVDIDEGDGADEFGGDEGGSAAPRQAPFRNGILFCVDVHVAEQFFQEDGEDRLTWTGLMGCLLKFVKNRIVSSENEKVGLVLFGTRGSRNAFNMDNIFEVLNLDYLGVKTVKSLQQLCGLTYEDFKAGYGTLRNIKANKMATQVEVCPISSLFKYALRAFKLYASPPSRFLRKLLLFTHREDPCKNCPQDRNVATQLGSDLLLNQVSLELFPLCLTSSAPFNLNAFYATLLTRSELQRFARLYEDTALLDTKSARCTDLLKTTGQVSAKSSLKGLEELDSELTRKTARNRVLTRTRLRLLPNHQISVAVFSIVSEARKPLPVLLRAVDHKPVRSVTKWIDSETGDILAREQMRKVYVFDGARACLEETELEEIRTVHAVPRYEAFPDVNVTDEGKTRFVLLGFQPLPALERYRLSLRYQTYWIFPVESDIAGSSVAFQALTESMWTLQKVALLSWQYRANSAPRMYVAVPELDSQGTAGMYLMALPYAEEIRHLDPELLEPQQNGPVPNPADICKLDELLGALDLGEDWLPQKIQNPAISKFWSGLEALALNSSEVVVPDLGTEPNPTLFQTPRVQELLADLAIATMAISRAKKREVSKGSESEVKKAKATMSVDQLKAHAANGELQRLTVAELKEYLGMFGLQVSGVKAILILRLESHLKSKDST